MIKKLIIFLIILGAIITALVIAEQDRESPFDAKAFFGDASNVIVAPMPPKLS
jgi:hypothetical protein